MALVLAVAAALGFGVVQVLDKAGAVAPAGRLADVAAVQTEVSSLLDRLQAERDVAAAVVDPAARSAQLPRRMTDADAAAERLRVAVDGLAGLGAAQDSYQRARRALVDLGGVREEALAGRRTGLAAIGGYQAVIEAFWAFDGQLAQQIGHESTRGLAAARHQLVAVREQVRRQRTEVAVLNGSSGDDPAVLDAARATAARQAFARGAFAASAPPSVRDRLLPEVNGDAERARADLVRGAIAAAADGASPAVDQVALDDATNASVAALDSVARELTRQMIAASGRVQADARDAAGQTAAVVFAVLMVVGIVGWLTSASILRPLRTLHVSASDTATRRLPGAVAQLVSGTTRDVGELVPPPVPVWTPPEFGRVARAVDAMSAEAVWQAGDQARLRRDTTEMFIGMARRSDRLVVDQLSVIDRLEAGEQDADRLATLFQLDHFATRIRRNAQSMQLLVDLQPVGQNERPVRLIDLLRAVVSEVESYQDVVLRVPPPVLVHGRAAIDLVHLLAELLDNATQYSPERSRVVLGSRIDPTGVVIVEVADRGPGMTADRLAEANSRLSDPTIGPVGNRSLREQMGLLIVSRLAARQQVGVRLEPGPQGTGLTAFVTLPGDLVRPERPVADDQGIPAGRTTDAQAWGASPADGEVVAPLEHRPMPTHRNRVTERSGPDTSPFVRLDRPVRGPGHDEGN